MQCKKCDILEKNISRGRENYVEFFAISRFVNKCRNSNLMNSKIVTFVGYYSHSVKNCCILENKIYYEEKKIT